MASELAIILNMLAIIISITYLILHRLRLSRLHQNVEIEPVSIEALNLAQKLATALPNSVILPHNAEDFKKGLKAYWAEQESEVIPACIVRPRTVQELSTAIKIFKREYDDRESGQDANKGPYGGIFAVRGGGHSPVPVAASIKGGAQVDLRYLNSVTPSEDGESVVIGGGARWMDVSRVLDERGLAVAGGRNAEVGVGGFTLGGVLSYFTHRFGLVCSNVISYEVVLADGSITTASADNNRDLWRALKGGSNNFGVVTKFTLKSFPCGKIWGDLNYYPAFQATKLLAAFHETIDKMDNDDFSHGAGLIITFSYLPRFNLQVLGANLASTALPENPKKWPNCWQATPFSSLWRYWSTCKVQTVTSATWEMANLNMGGRRQTFGSTTILNDPATVSAAHRIYTEAFNLLRSVNPKGMAFSIIFQPFLASWARKGDENPLGLRDTTESLVIVSFAVNWDKRTDDEFVKSTVHLTLEKIEAFAAANKTSHRFRYLNYCNEWQKPFESYGEENWQFLKDVSRKYDPEGLFQRGCVGGFKLDIEKRARD
ncbi:hypothetical protein HYALB_00001426 [Hymenoscyphus albidus]|uniref:FAD-binding PCMH-type domain-containing protein n=1 Tax=Hymenoscyphus albidus TaxID=595503 RepID=A0A9N9LDL5_9HELO|nr:hypothetical protein HYALB_00001426 [Hymenoscyphus albidus]